MKFSRFALALLILLLVSLIAGCTGEASRQNPIASSGLTSAFPVPVTDDAGQTLTFNAPPSRIISLSPGNTEILYALGLGDKIIVTDKYSDYPPENAPKAKLITYPKPNIEEIVSLQPDLIVVLVEGEEFIQQMSPRGIKVLRLFPKDFEGALHNIDTVGRITGTQGKATEIINKMRSRAAAVVAKTKNAPKPRVLYELDASDETKPFVAGPVGFFGSLLPMAGGENIFNDLGRTSAQVSTEQIVARDPEVIVLADVDSPYNAQTPEMVKARHGWAGITAIKNNRIYPMNQAFLSRAGPRLVDGLEQMAQDIHPELFP